MPSPTTTNVDVIQRLQRISRWIISLLAPRLCTDPVSCCCHASCLKLVKLTPPGKVKGVNGQPYQETSQKISQLRVKNIPLYPVKDPATSKPKCQSLFWLTLTTSISWLQSSVCVLAALWQHRRISEMAFIYDNVKSVQLMLWTPGDTCGHPAHDCAPTGQINGVKREFQHVLTKPGLQRLSIIRHICSALWGKQRVTPLLMPSSAVGQLGIILLSGWRLSCLQCYTTISITGYAASVTRVNVWSWWKSSFGYSDGVKN